MEDTNTIERDISSVRRDIQTEQNQLSHDPIGANQAAITTELGSNERTLRTLEQKEERAKEYDHAHGFGQ